MNDDLLFLILGGGSVGFGVILTTRHSSFLPVRKFLKSKAERASLNRQNDHKKNPSIGEIFWGILAKLFQCDLCMGFWMSVWLTSNHYEPQGVKNVMMILAIVMVAVWLRKTIAPYNGEAQ